MNQLNELKPGLLVKVWDSNPHLNGHVTRIVEYVEGAHVQVLGTDGELYCVDPERVVPVKAHLPGPAQPSWPTEDRCRNMRETISYLMSNDHKEAAELLERAGALRLLQCVQTSGAAPHLAELVRIFLDEEG